MERNWARGVGEGRGSEDRPLQRLELGGKGTRKGMPARCWRYEKNEEPATVGGRYKSGKRGISDQLFARTKRNGLSLLESMVPAGGIEPTA